MYKNYVFFEGNDLNICFLTSSWGRDIDQIKSHFMTRDGVLWQRNCPVWGENPMDGFKLTEREDALALILG